ncbi:unnamed protein product [Fraxinus pennsylvanica]|uniref:Uncharacterized protein n=1 Tax=Fraxinus pennsylvanica TaxID=56036 RepID=A0AAD1ZKH8_9LAMI|nr:unnamed protein product [Fraxinus pennsylvanica]
MAEGTRFSQLSEVVTQLKNENTEMKEAQTRQQTLLEELVKQMKERRDRGLCYYCDDKWALGHRCRTPNLFLLEGLEAETEEDIFEDVSEEPAMREEQNTDQE